MMKMIVIIMVVVVVVRGDGDRLDVTLQLHSCVQF